MKVFLVDDHSVFRAGVKAEISDAVDIVGEAGTVADAIAGINATDPDVVLLDVHMPDGGGVAVVRSILSQQGIGRNRRFLALSVSDAFARPDPVGAGVVNAPESDRAVEEGKPVADPIVDALTRRELEVLKLLARGYTYKEIAAELFISVKTVETHASNILRKTQQSNRHALSRWAQSHDLD
ncbi:LuxR C-terminal-related transcriptional regulator [Corynebacterium diphtheriae]